MPFLFYSGAPLGSKLELLSGDHSALTVELTATAASADLVSYEPLVATDWIVPPPDDVAEALDQLSDTKRSKTVNTSSAGPVPSPYGTDTPPTLFPVKSGRFLCWWSFSGIITVAGQVTANGRIDGADIANTSSTGNFAAGQAWSLSSFWIVNLNRTVSHTVGWQITFTGGGNLINVANRFMTWEA